MSVQSITRGRVRVEQGHKRVRVFLGGHLVADTTRPLLVWEAPYYPTYYIPIEDLHASLTDTGTSEHSPSRGDATVYDVTVGRVEAGGVEAGGVAAGDVVAAGAARRFADSPIPELRDAVRLTWASMDEWFEEDEPVYTHARDPYTRVDILASSRHIRVEVDGVILAESSSPHILFETGLPPRYYLPITDLRTDLLRPSTTVTHCPYKGAATYWSVQIGDTLHGDLVWCYRSPLPESQRIGGMACFYSERVNLYVDGQLQERPRPHH